MTQSIKYLLIINSNDQPLLFKSYTEIQEDLNIQLHSFASLDFLQQKLANKPQEYLDKIYTIYNSNGEYSIYAFTTATKLKILAIFKEQGLTKKLVDEEIESFFYHVYQLYKKQLFKAFGTLQQENRLSEQFYYQLDSYVEKTKFKIIDKAK